MPTTLTREYRFFLRPDGDYTVKGNSWSGAASGAPVAPFLTLRATLTGSVDPATGYLINIQDIDHALAELVQTVYAQRRPAAWTYVDMLQESHRLRESFGGAFQVVATELAVSPFLTFRLDFGEQEMLTISQEFEFSAAHRLDCPTMSAEENQRYFGKCNHPNGHGHNYVVAVTMQCRDAQFPLAEFEANVKRLVIDRFDHQHLNLDLPDFADLNPSVENIARVVWDLLRAEPFFADLQNVRVYETPKTWADYHDSSANTDLGGSKTRTTSS
jgi:6-pyruvoyltetrahydropterin/6-carboxytetrahydropterin synthase